MNTITILNRKGGTGKTTTAVNLGAALAREGKKALLIDLDSQCSSTLHLGFQPNHNSPSITNVIKGERAFSVAIKQTSTRSLFISPADPSLSNIFTNPSKTKGKEKLLQQRIEEMKDKFDFILIDCAPSFNFLTINALMAADWSLIPVNPDYLSLEGLKQFLETLEGVKESFQTELRVLGFIFTRVDIRKKITSEAINLLRESFPDKVFETEIKINVKLEEAPSHGQTIFEYSPQSAGAKCYQKLGEEVLNRCDKEKVRKRK